ncbi:MAG: hypothetical protein JO257_18550 [Deltaproteobacteria bacterium]|nr:hypothetical protein [Deltaproteobacteria bacterium]
MKTVVALALVAPMAMAAHADVPDEGVHPDGQGSAAAPAGSTQAPGEPGDSPALQTSMRHKDIVVTTPGERSPKNIAILASVAGAGAIVGGIGVYFNLDSRSAANEVSAHRPMSVPWTADRQATYDRAHDSAVKAGVFYGIGGALVLGAVVGLIVTVPKAETTVIHPHVAIGPEGASIGGSWSW